MKTISFFISGAILLFLSACSGEQQQKDASGSFEAEETIISAEANGTVRQFDLEEGQQLKTGQMIGYIDTVQLYLRKKQLEAQIGAMLSKRPDVSLQVAALEEQLKTAEREQKRISSLVKADAATTKQLDDINGQIEVLSKQIAAQRSSLGISSDGIAKETLPLSVQIEQVNDLLQKSRIINPVNGTVLAKYANAGEMAVQGKPLYKIADLGNISLRAYIIGSQLSEIKIGQQVNVRIDNGEDDYKVYPGIIRWISAKSEFSPKTIQTKDERANLVYAVKIGVKNDGYLKIGMYGEVIF